MKINIRKIIRECLNENDNSLIPEFIIFNSEKVSTRNSNNDYISNDIKSIEKFYEWFGNSKMVDSNNKPMVCYHISHSTFDTFRPSLSGKMGGGMYFTTIYSELSKHTKYGGNIIYSCYLKIDNLLEIQQPFSKRDDNNDGIIAGRGEDYEEIKVNKPNQIKSIDNNGGWDINSSNIYN